MDDIPAESDGHRAQLQRIAHRVMIERGFEPDFPERALSELKEIRDPAASPAATVRDLRDRPWCSIDNDDSRDLDQITVAEALPGGATGVLVAIADVDAAVRYRTALDDHARRNTTSVYTAAAVYPMLPEPLSTDLTSLAFGADRLAVVVDLELGSNGSLQAAEIYQAAVRNHAKLAYSSTGAWLEQRGPIPEAVKAVAGLEENLRLQDGIARKLKECRHQKGALSLETVQARPIFDGSRLRELAVEKPNRAKTIIEDFMIAANTAAARYLSTRKFPTIRRIVRMPKDWGRIVELAAQKGSTLPADPDPVALERFLSTARASDPLRFPDLSLSVIKLIGPGEYVVERPGDETLGHFGLAVDDYTHSTAPNRRYPDLVIQRILKAAIAGRPHPYGEGELDSLAAHCTDRADEAKKVERQVAKSAAALLLESRIGETFDALVTGAGPRGTWVRLLSTPVEGKFDDGARPHKVGDAVRVRLVHTDVEQGHIDFQGARMS